MANEIDPTLIDDLKIAAARVVEDGLNKLSDIGKHKVNAAMDTCSLYLHVQMHPTCVVVVALDPFDPAEKPIELMRVEVDTPESIKRLLN